jgi:FkbM family methyltransferase
MHALSDPLPLPGGRSYRLCSVDGPADFYLAAVLATGLQETEWQLAMGWLRPGEVFFDLGANIGAFAIPAAVLGVETHAFELLPANVASLERAAAANGLERLSIISAALGEAPGVMGYRGTSAWGSVGPPARRHAGIVTLDAYAAHAGVPRVDFIKVDIEGSEGPTLRGAAGLLARDRPDLLLEVNVLACGTVGHDHRDALRQLAALGYRFFEVTPDVLLEVPPPDPQSRILVDYLCSVRDDAAIAERAARPVRRATDADLLAALLAQAGTNEHHYAYVAMIHPGLPPAVRDAPELCALVEAWRVHLDHADAPKMRRGLGA